MFNPFRWLVEFVREMDRGMAVMRGEVQPGAHSGRRFFGTTSGRR